MSNLSHHSDSAREHWLSLYLIPRLIGHTGERVWKNERVRPYPIADCQFAGIDGNQAHCCSNGCTCSSSHSGSFVFEHDVKRIAKEISKDRMTEEERKRLERGFTLAGLTSDPSMRLFNEIMSRRAGPKLERFPWVRDGRIIHYLQNIDISCDSTVLMPSQPTVVYRTLPTVVMSYLLYRNHI